jgi:hemerythrin
MKWREELRTNIESLDSEHQMLMSLINDLHEARLLSKDPAVLHDNLLMLEGYTRAHFAAEEEQMKQLHYPDYETHKALHDALVSSVRDMVQRFESGESVLTIESMQFMRRWLTEHILLTDKKLGAYLHQVNTTTVVMPKFT